MRGLLSASALLVAVAIAGGAPASHAAESTQSGSVPRTVTSLQRPATASQAITQDMLKAVLLATDDLPQGFMQFTDSTLDLPAGDGITLAGVLRGYVSRSGTGVVIELLGIPNDSLGDVAPSSIGEQLLRSAATSSGPQIANFTMTGPLGIGDDDVSAVWDFYSPGSDRWLVSYADVFLQGHVLATVSYLGLPEVTDPTALDSYAQLQDAHIVTAGLP